MCISLCVPAWASQSVTLGWDASPSGDVAGYTIHYGTNSTSYSNVVTVGITTNATISGLVEGRTYYFAVTAFNSGGQQSAYSNETGYTVPVPLSNVQLGVSPSGQFVLTVAGVTGRTYEVQATQTFTNWTVIGSVTVGAGGSVQFTDTDAANYTARYYRMRDTQL